MARKTLAALDKAAAWRHVRGQQIRAETSLLPKWSYVAEDFARAAYIAGRQSERRRRNREDRAEFVADRQVERSLTR